MNKNFLAVAVVVILLVAGGIFYLRGRGDQPGDPGVSPEEAANADAVVTYTDSGFSPANLTVKKGDTVLFKNEGSKRMWVASALHPTHENYDSTNRESHCAAEYSGPAPFDQCAAGDSYLFTFDKAGDWKYHNHVGPADFGGVTVE